MEEDFLDHLKASAALTGLVGSHIQWASRDRAPSVALHLIDALPEQHLKGEAGLAFARVQIDCWAETFLAAKAIGAAVRTALPAIGLGVGDTTFLSCRVLSEDRSADGQKPNLLHRTRIDVRVAYRPA